MITVKPQDALLIIDVQNDFLPGGSLAVPGGDEIISVINRLGRLPFGAVIATQDWHPVEHMSFVGSGGLWPEHCVAGTQGAELATLLSDEFISIILRKGRYKESDSYSAFFDNAGRTTGLSSLMDGLGIARVFIAGLALDVCVTATAKDAQKTGFDTFVIMDACRGIGSVHEAETRLSDVGIAMVQSDGLA
ncbi:isochorismatase family protein [Acetobacter oeni]|uniref:nicotinamidase n=2 Tax=Acetobacter oeni TaxID=304077 RepID=A0A511XQ63_9PROT|nr:isochorismatase family protein [Acetobacter oeni]NHO20657.1 isochorismatase family protein [Acetobacter oeni]GBR04782.1 nicotinamidase [Acetobacter oeni LMG 21952]GEN65039.1 bifunctional pyrazinamidase/nicotinamidase [Acetobacter oeni]